MLGKRNYYVTDTLAKMIDVALVKKCTLSLLVSEGSLFVSHPCNKLGFKTKPCCEAPGDFWVNLEFVQ